MVYNQTLKKETYYSCTIYTILNMLRYDFCVKIEDSLILKLVAYMEKIGKLLPKGADFNIIYPAVVGLINLRYGIKLKIEKSSISKGLDDDNSWSLGVKGFSSKGLKKGTDDGLMSKDDIDWILGNIKTGSGHNHMIKKRKNSDTRMILDSWGGVKYEIKLEDLKYSMQKGLYYDTARRIVAEDEKTKLVKFRCYTLYTKLGRELTEEEFKKVIY